MPSFVGHSVFGLAIDRLLPLGRKGGVLSVIFISNAPDLDFIPGLLSKKPGSHHARTTHSLAGVLISGMLNGIISWHSRRSFLLPFTRGAALYSSHLVLDLLSKEGPGGIPLLWPFTSRQYVLPWTLFVTIRSRKRSGFVKGLLNRNNTHAVRRELALTLPVLLLAVTFRRLIQ